MNTAILYTVQNIFIGADELNWTKVENSFAGKILLDYTSMSGGEPAVLTPQQITTAWKAVFPGFKATHHQLGNMEMDEQLHEATVSCYGMASHYLPDERGNVWIVVGTYNFHLVRTEDKWKVDIMKFNFKYQDGNTALPQLAAAKAKQ